MAPHAYSTHVKITTHSDDGWQPRTGRDGSDRTVNLKSILTTLKAANYDGPFCIEAGIFPDEGESARDAVVYVKELLAQI
jgi:sugar phosphate isomerase/epimerase